MIPLDQAALAALGDELPEWRISSDALFRQFRFPTFAAAVRFMADQVAHIDAADHHPEWTNVYDRLDVRLTTHDAGGRVTSRDVSLARHLEKAYRAWPT